MVSNSFGAIEVPIVNHAVHEVDTSVSSVRCMGLVQGLWKELPDLVKLVDVVVDDHTNWCSSQEVGAICTGAVQVQE